MSGFVLKIRRWAVRKKVAKINGALNIKLEDWQIDYLLLNRPLDVNRERTKEAQTLMLKQILSAGSKYYWRINTARSTRVIVYRKEGYFPINDDRGDSSVIYHRSYLIQWKRTYLKLQKAGIPVADVSWAPIPASRKASVERVATEPTSQDQEVK